MDIKTLNTDTIVALATPQGIGAIGIIRLSGARAFEIGNAVFATKDLKRKQLQNYASHTIHYGVIMEGDIILDEVLVSIFKAPHSYTSENTLEISCHGSNFIQQQLIQLFIKHGARMAQHGEFTLRAFLNGKLDLSQAEAVADLIASNSATSHQVAIQQMRGGFSNKIKTLRQNLIDFASLIELELDFSEEDVEFADRSKLSELARVIEAKISELAGSFKVGNVLKKGIPVALVGETNVGKSTLLNLLINEEKAIVSDIHGTTRDSIEDLVDIDGISFRFIDTAGIRKTKDTIENLGIERTYQKIEQSEIVLWIVDCTQVTEHIEWLTEKIARRAEGKKIILVFNKIDKLIDDEREVIDQLFSRFEAERVYISAKRNINTHHLREALVNASQLKEINPGDVIVNNVRHYEALLKAGEAIQRVISGIDTGIPSDFLSRDIRDCMYHLGEITGQISSDEILGNIFGKFCIGK